MHLQGYLTKVREDNLFTNEDADVIFSNIEQLYEFHKEFLQELKHAVNMEAMENSNVGEVFLKNVSAFPLHSKFSSFVFIFSKNDQVTPVT